MSEIKAPGLEDNLSYRGAPYQQLITDKDGNAQWEDRLVYSESTKKTIEDVRDGKLKYFPTFAVGDTVTVNVDGVEHSLVAYYDNDRATIGDTYTDAHNQTGEFGWCIYVDREDSSVWLHAGEEHTVSYFGEKVKKIDRKYLPKAAFITNDNGDFSSNFSHDELYERLLCGENVIYHKQNDNSYKYLMSWSKLYDGILLSFDNTTTLLFSRNGTISAQNKPVVDPSAPS